MSDPDMPPALPEGKLYHAMFNFQSDDRRWVRKILSKLEADPYKLKCCIADRDFHPGKEVITNIEECMSQSMNIILVITPNFLESHYCDYETCMAHEMMHSKIAKIIPVLRRGEEIPASLRFINNIDARDDVDDTYVVNKLARALTEGLDEKSGPHSVVSNESNINGDGISIFSQMEGRFSRTYKTALVKEHIDAAKHLGLKATAELLEIICDIANQSSLFAQHFWYYTHFGRFLIFTFDSIAVVLISRLLLLVYTLGRVEMILAVSGAWSLLWFWSVVRILVVRWKTKNNKDLFGYKMTTLTKKLNILVYLDVVADKPAVKVVYYDFRKCTNFIEDCLRKEIQNNMTSQNLNTEDINNLAERIVEDTLPAYISVFGKGHPSAPHPRHPVRRELVCLCQTVSMDLIRRYIYPDRRGEEGRMFECLRRNTTDTVLLIDEEATNHNTVQI